MIIDQHTYRKAFQEYLRKGTPIMWSIKQDRPTTHYIWRTRNDGNVRSAHAEREGEIFSWDNPPPGGHPGEDYGCRCTAEPYVPELNEKLTITLHDISDSGSPWTSADFVEHYFSGRGRGVTVRQTGHLSAIVERYMGIVEERIKNNIAVIARQNFGESFSDHFERSYDMTGIAFPIGDTTIGGHFRGLSDENLGILSISGEIEFYIRDEFADPVDIGEVQRRLGRDDAQDVEVIDLGETIFENIHRPLDNYLRGRVGLPPTGPERLGIHTGDPYTITDSWSGSFEGRIYLDPTKSEYK